MLLGSIHSHLCGMSYVTQDRHGACTTHYASIKSTDVAGTGKTWWPDFGPSLRDHSFQERFFPHHHIFEKVVKPHTTGRDRAPPPLEREPKQFRNPAPARQAMLLRDQPTNEQRLAAKEVTDRQSHLRMLEVRQRRIDSWLEEPPIRMKAVGSSSRGKALRCQSEPVISASSSATQVSRETYEKLGFLVGRSKGSIADGLSGANGAKRRHNPLSLNSLMFSGSVVDGNRAGRSLSRSALPKKPSKQWQVLPESSFVFDPRTSLPVPRGGWNSQPSSTWPEPPAAGHREWSAPVTFDARRKPANMEALPEWPVSPTAMDRKVTAGLAASTVRKHPYGEVREPGQETKGLSAQDLQNTAKLKSTGGLNSTGGMDSSTASAMRASQ